MQQYVTHIGHAEHERSHIWQVLVTWCGPCDNVLHWNSFSTFNNFIYLYFLSFSSSYHFINEQHFEYKTEKYINHYRSNYSTHHSTSQTNEVIGYLNRESSCDSWIFSLQASLTPTTWCGNIKWFESLCCIWICVHSLVYDTLTNCGPDQL